MRRTRWFTMVVTAVMCFAYLAPVNAQSFPSRPIRLLVPFPPGGASDQVSRLLGQKISESTGQALIVDNRPGGGAQIAATALMQAPADGYNLLIGDIGAFAINTSLYQNLSFNPQRDFQPISLVMSSPMVLLVPTKSPANSVSELLEIPRRGPGHLSYASQGIGTGGHLLAEMFKHATKMMKGSSEGTSRAIAMSEKGKTKHILEIVTKPGATLANPAVLAGVGAVMSQYAMQQQMDEIVEYLQLINEKVDDILRSQKDAVLADMIGRGPHHRGLRRGMRWLRVARVDQRRGV